MCLVRAAHWLCIVVVIRCSERSLEAYSLTISLRVVAFCCVNFETGEVLWILILTRLGITLFWRHFWLKQMLALQHINNNSSPSDKTLICFPWFHQEVIGLMGVIRFITLLNYSFILSCIHSYISFINWLVDILFGWIDWLIYWILSDQYCVSLPVTLVNCHESGNTHFNSMNCILY